MNLWNIKRTLSRMSRRARPDTQFVNALRRELASKGYLPAIRVHFFRLWWARVIAGGSLVVMSLTAATGTYAYASPKVLPDHPLYRVRTAIEQVQLNTARSATAKTKVQSKLIARHLNSLARSVAVREKLDDEEAEDQGVLQEDVQDMVALEQQILLEITEDKTLFDEDEKVLLNEALKEQAQRVQQRLELIKQTRRNKS